MSEKCKYCDYVSKCSRFCEYNSVMCLMHRSFPKIVDKTYEELEKENQELKKQLENCYCNRTDCVGRIKDSKLYDSLVQKIENQQQEFIEWLEKEIEAIENKLNRYNELVKQGKETDFEYYESIIDERKLDIYIKTLRKYKSIMEEENE